MKTIIIVTALFLSNTLGAQGCIDGRHPSQPRYICFDGRTVEKTDVGLVWNAKRGCFLSSLPCCNYDAIHYAFYENSAKIGEAYARCRHDYPFRLGTMQAH
jgi:hypothetical protein